MSLFKIVTFLTSASLVAGHGYISGLVADGKHYDGFIVDKYSYMDDPPETIGWSTTATDLGFVSPSAYQSPDVICHENAKPGALTAPVTAGSNVQLEWTEWPESHHGPVITYLASCDGDCANVDKSTLKFFKIDTKGLLDNSDPPGTWATDEMIDNNNVWTVTIPSDIASGNYVLRNEIIALHSAGDENGAQNYPQCLNIKVIGGGSKKPEGTAGTKLYEADAPGILCNIYTKIKDYVMPGPKQSTSATTDEPASSPTATNKAITVAPESTTQAAPSSTASSAGGATAASPSATSNPGNSGARNSGYGSCSDPSIKWTRGLNGRKQASWTTTNQDSFPHGSSTTISTLTSFICNRLVSPCNAPQETIDLCHASMEEIAGSELTGETKSELWNKLMA